MNQKAMPAGPLRRSFSEASRQGFSQIILLGIIAALILAGASGFLILREKKIPSSENEKTVRQEVPSEDMTSPIEPTQSPLQSMQPPRSEIRQELKPKSAPQTTQLVQMSCGNEIGNGAEIISGPSGPAGADRDNPFRSLTVHPFNADVILVGTERNGFVKSTDGGNTWKRFRYGVRHEGEGYTEIYDVGIAVSNLNTIYAATTLGGPGPLTGNYPSSGGGVYKSNDGGETWERKNCGIQNNGGRTTTVYVDPNDANHAFIGVSAGTKSWGFGDMPPGQFFSGGIYVTTDGGENWAKVNAAENDDKNGYSYIRSAKSTPSLLFTFGFADDPNSNVGFLKSVDNGKTWRQFAPELKDLHIRHFDVSSDGNTIYAMSDSEGNRKISKSTDGGNTWSNYPFVSGYTVTASPSDANRVLVGVFDGLYLSTNGWQSQNQVITLIGDQRISDVQFAPSNTNIVYVVTYGYVLYKSTDSGNSFTKIKDIRNEVLNVLP